MTTGPGEDAREDRAARTAGERSRTERDAGRGGATAAGGGERTGEASAVPDSDRTAAPGGDRIWTVLDLLRWTTDHFTQAGLDSPRLDAECLLAHALGVRRLDLYLRFDQPVDAAERARFRELVRRRGGERVPVAQLTGSKEFWSLDFEVGPEVLTPRPDTETLGEAALAALPEADAAARVLDVGTGSGAVAIAISHERPKAWVVATDVSESALACTARNAERHGVSDRIHLARGPLFEPVAGEVFDLVVSNPPYLAEAEAAALEPELAWEPREALFAGPDGLAVLRDFIGGLRAVLAPSGRFAVEVAATQVPGVVDLCRGAGLAEVDVRPDLAGRGRVVEGRRDATAQPAGSPGPPGSTGATGPTDPTGPGQADAAGQPDAVERDPGERMERGDS